MSELSVHEMNRIIEAVLFAAGHPLSYDKIAEVLQISKKEARKIVKNFADFYNADDSRGLILLTFDDSCQLAAKEQYGSYIRTALNIKNGGNLSRSSLEILAIVAYNQPVTRAYIDEVRGVDSTYSVSSLIQKGLLKVKGHLDVPGRPALLVTTEEFLRCFGLSSISDLPAKDTFVCAQENVPLQISIAT